MTYSDYAGDDKHLRGAIIHWIESSHTTCPDSDVSRSSHDSNRPDVNASKEKNGAGQDISQIHKDIVDEFYPVLIEYIEEV